MSRPGLLSTVFFSLAVLPLLAQPSDPAEPPLAREVPPKRVTLPAEKAPLQTLLESLQKQTGISVAASGVEAQKAVSVPLENQSFWVAVERLAKSVDGRVATRAGGKRVVIEPGTTGPSAVTGPFRVAVRQVRSITDFETGRSYTELALDTMWESRFEVFRISSSPTITTAVDNEGNRLTVGSAGSKTPASGYSQQSTIRLAGVPRSATRLARVQGNFTVTTAEKMLAFQFPNLTSEKTEEKTASGVTVRLKPLRKVGEIWEFEVELKYPPDRPVFESFEGYIWASRNKARLIAPGGAAVYEADADPDFPEDPGRVSIVYRFTEKPAKKFVLGDRREWTFVYQTPSPLLEYAVPFELRDIPLP